MSGFLGPLGSAFLWASADDGRERRTRTGRSKGVAPRQSSAQERRHGEEDGMREKRKKMGRWVSHVQNLATYANCSDKPSKEVK